MLGKCGPKLAEPEGATGKISAVSGWEGRTE